MERPILIYEKARFLYVSETELNLMFFQIIDAGPFLPFMILLIKFSLKRVGLSINVVMLTAM